MAVFDDLVSGATESQLGPISGAPSSDHDHGGAFVASGSQHDVDGWAVHEPHLEVVVAVLSERFTPLIDMVGDLLLVVERGDVLAVEDLGQPEGVNDQEGGTGRRCVAPRQEQCPLGVRRPIDPDDHRADPRDIHDDLRFLRRQRCALTPSEPDPVQHARGDGPATGSIRMIGQTVRMAVFANGSVSLHYDVEGDGFPVLLIAPGGMRSANELWNDMPWNPRTALSDDYRVIGMDQRNAGRSTGPVGAGDGWATYTGDQLALLDHLDVDRCHVIGMCIGGPYIMGLLAAAPERFASAIVLQPVGIDDNRDAMYEMFDLWVETIADSHPDMSESDWASFRSNMWDGEFVLTASVEQAAACTTPMLVAMGNDLYHPESTSRRLAEAVTGATLVEEWKQGPPLSEFDGTIGHFLAEHTP
jgi:pimeloyl-ACP methyl ester carboxylesterase